MSVFKLTVWLHTVLRPEHFQFSIFIGSGLELMIFHKMSPRTHSLRSKRFQSSYCAKVRAGAKKKGGRRRGEEKTLARKTHDSGKRPLIFHVWVHL